MTQKTKPIICIDAGHGGYDSGATRESRHEKKDNLAMALAIQKELTALGCCVLLTRSDDRFVSLAQRATFANKEEACVFLSVHRNAFTTSEACGVENWIYQGDKQSSKQLAEQILAKLNQVGTQKNRGVKAGDFYVLRNTQMPACLLELGFLSNEKDNVFFDTHFADYAKAIASGIVSFLGMNLAPEIKNPDKKLYRVQVGAFSDKENALSLQKELVQKGYQTFITQS